MQKHSLPRFPVTRCRTCGSLDIRYGFRDVTTRPKQLPYRTVERSVTKTTHWVQCSRCGMTTDECDSRGNAALIWNRNTGDN